jgi:membrane protease YdiL (CAAX protease family)
MALRGHPGRQALAFLVWITAVAAGFDFGIFSLSLSPWAGTGLQVLGYALDVAPILIWSPGTLRTLPAPRAQILIGAVGVLAALAVAGSRNLYPDGLPEAVVGFAATGFGEELSFRGFLWERLQAAGLPTAGLVAANVAAFVAWHLVAVASGGTGAGNLLDVLWFGVLVSLVRLGCGNTGLPALLHMAFRIAGI